MPESELCVYCKYPIYPTDNFVRVKPGAQDSVTFGAPMIDEPHAHAKCHEQMVALEKNFIAPYSLRTSDTTAP
jgi:hypothetical protein